ncbi:MAG: Metallophosphoesterase [Bacteroidota bacterium]|nr:Metallophosphoesterase [Bacteroidota bacterium]
MKSNFFLIFISIVLTIYTSANYYIFIRGWQSLEKFQSLRIPYLILFLIVCFSYIIHIVFFRSNPTSFGNIFTYIGSYWFGAMLYFFLLIVLFDFLRLINHFFPFFPYIISSNYPSAKFYTAISSVITVIIVLTAGYINAINPIVKELNISISKTAGKLKKLRAVIISDVHIGNIIDNGRVTKLVKSINELNPDIVLFAGDILDEEVQSVLKNDSGIPLKNLKSKYGVYAIPGNHEYIAGAERALKYIRTLNINLLVDSIAEIDNSFYIIGRDDRDGFRFAGKKRKQLDSLIENLDKTKPMILLDHQPLHLEDAERAGIDLQFSGHTHNGQIFPINLITKKIYEQDFGFLRKGSTQYYVSCGYGTWGPPLRLGNRPEIVLCHIKFK